MYNGEVTGSVLSSGFPYKVLPGALSGYCFCRDYLPANRLIRRLRRLLCVLLALLPYKRLLYVSGTMYRFVVSVRQGTTDSVGPSFTQAITDGILHAIQTQFFPCFS